MDPQPPDPSMTEQPVDGSLESLLDAFHAHPEWTERQRDDHLDQLVARVPAERLVEAARLRLGDLGGALGDAVLRIIESYPSEPLLRELAHAVIAQPDLPPERAWEALSMLEGAELLDEFPELAARAEEMDELFNEEDSLKELAEQLEGDPEGTWLALQGLGAVEPEIRPQIITSLAQGEVGPGLAEFLRLLCFAHDPPTQVAALEALARPYSVDEPHIVKVWETLEIEHPDQEVMDRARDWLSARPSGTDLAATGRSQGGSVQATPSVIRSLVTALDGQGRGSIVLAAQRGESINIAAFLCDVTQGIHDVMGQVHEGIRPESGLFDQLIEQTDLEVVEDVPELALRLLGGAILLCGQATPPALRYWLEATVPTGFRALPFPTPFPGWNPARVPFEEMPARSQAVLDACPRWLDTSDLAYKMAEEITLREVEAPRPDPKRDSGLYRYYFEHRILGQLEFYRRMLYWMASFWQGADRPYLGQSALTLAEQLSDAQHAVPSHPFVVELITRSLVAAQVRLLKREQGGRGRVGRGTNGHGPQVEPRR